MEDIFKTFKPINPTIAKFIDYYYIDIKPQNKVTEFYCFPHFNNTISLYKSHIRPSHGVMVYEENAQPFQIFTPIREDVLKVKQIGALHRVVIVFNPLGIQHFYKNLNFTEFITDYRFFDKEETDSLFNTTEVNVLRYLLDNFLESRFQEFCFGDALVKAVAHTFSDQESFSVEQLAKSLHISRRHLNRLFKEYLGVSIKRFYEIVLFRKTINKKLYNSPDESFTKLAYELNYNDQSHLIKAFQKFTKNPPSLFFKKGTQLGKEDTFWHIVK